MVLRRLSFRFLLLVCFELVAPKLFPLVESELVYSAEFLLNGAESG